MAKPTSAWVRVYVAVHVVDSPGARGAVAPHATKVFAALPLYGPLRVTLPVLVSVWVKPPGSHLTSPDLSLPGIGPCPSTSLRTSRSLTATNRCGPS